LYFFHFLYQPFTFGKIFEFIHVQIGPDFYHELCAIKATVLEGPFKGGLILFIPVPKNIDSHSMHYLKLPMSVVDGSMERSPFIIKFIFEAKKEDSLSSEPDGVNDGSLAEIITLVWMALLN
jgi:hypothetical protein